MRLRLFTTRPVLCIIQLQVVVISPNSGITRFALTTTSFYNMFSIPFLAALMRPQAKTSSGCLLDLDDVDFIWNRSPNLPSN